MVDTASSAERGDQARHADEANIAYNLDDRDVVLSPVLLHFDFDRAFPSLFRVPKPLMESRIVPA